MNEYLNFTNEALNEVCHIMGENYECVTREVDKNNGQKLTTLNIMKRGMNIAPCIYLDPYYMKYNRGESIKNIAKDIVDYYYLCMKSIPKYIENMSPDLDFESNRKKIRAKLINYEKNLERLKKVPYEIFLDLAITYQVEEDDYVVNITNDILESWKITKEQLIEEVRYNMENEKDWLFLDIMDSLGKPNTEVADEEREKLFVLTRYDRKYGAIEMTRADLLQQIGEKINSDFYIIPSSIHEVLIEPVNESVSEKMLKETLWWVNDNKVQTEEVLSDSIYLYSRKDGEIKVI